MLGTIREKLAAHAARLPTLLGGFGADKRANTAVIFALASLPMISAVGCVVDYSMASTVKTKLQAAADAAALATVSNNSPIVAAAKNQSANGTVTGGQAYAQNFFLADTTAFSGVTYSASVSKSGSTVTATLTFSDPVPTFFMKIIGWSNITVSGSSTATFTLPTYINFYLMLDVSGSMSFPSTTSEQAGSWRSIRTTCTRRTARPTMVIRRAANSPAIGLRKTPLVSKPRRKVDRAAPGRDRGRHRLRSMAARALPFPANGPSGYPGGYCMGFIISRLGTTPVSPTGCSGGSGTNDGNPPAAPSGRIPGTTHPVSLRLRPVCQLDQQPGQLVLQSRNDLVHPIARRRRRLCRDIVAVAGLHH